MLFAGIFVAIALGILVLAKVILWVLRHCADIHLLLFFDSTRNYAVGWLNQSLLYASITLFVHVIAAFLIAAMEPELTTIDGISGDRELKLSDFAAFIMLCIAGAFVLFQVQSLAQGIVGAFATAIGPESRAACLSRRVYLGRKRSAICAPDAGSGPSCPGSTSSHRGRAAPAPPCSARSRQMERLGRRDARLMLDPEQHEKGRDGRQSESALRSYFQQGDIWEQEIIKRAKRSARVAWFFSIVFAGIALLSLLAVVLMLPLKSFEPYVVTVDQTTGYIEVKSGLTRPANLTEQQAITQANVVRYIRAREGYDPYAITENFGIAALLSADEAARELQTLYSAANAQEPHKGLWPAEAGPRRDQVGDVPERQHGDRPVLHQRTQRHGIGRPSLDLRGALPLHDTPTRNEWRFENPLGFQVYSYRRDQETVTSGDGQ
jgi:type IV secretion system protein VirB8